MILAFKTNTPTCEMILYKNNKKLVEKKWEAGRQLSIRLPGELEDFLKENQFSWKDVKGIIVFQGPGSFTGLRIGITTANTIAYARGIPVIGIEGDNWIQDGLGKISKGEDDKIVLPHYGGPAHITKPKK